MGVAAWRAAIGAFAQHWAITARPTEFFYVAFNQIGAVSVFAWLARSGGRADAITLIAFGVVFMVIWRSSVFQLGFQLRNMNSQGTLELELMSRAPMFAIMLGKSLAAFAFYGIIGLFCFGAALYVGGSALAVGNPAALLVSLAIVSLAVIATSFIFAPFTFVVGGQAGFFNAIFPIGIALSGFVQPASVLPPAISLVARAIPTSWAMDALLLSVRGAPVGEIALRWGASVGLSALFFVACMWLFQVAERRVRQDGGGE